MEQKIYEFDALILTEGLQDIAYIELPFDVEQEFGTRAQIKVDVLFDGFRYRGSLARMGKPCHVLGLNKTVRAAIQKSPGDMVHVVLKKDTEPRTVEVASDIAEAMRSVQGVFEKFESLSYSRRKEWIGYIEDAKKPETRVNRIVKVIVAIENRKPLGKN